MRKKVLLALAIMASIPSFAGDRIAYDAATNTPHLSMPAWGGGDGGSNVHFTHSLFLGYSRISATDGTGTTSGGGFGWGLQMGAAIVMPGNNDTKEKIISFALHIEGLDGSYKYKDGLGNDHKDDVSVTTIGLPVTYTQLHYRSGSHRGFYWQLGANLDYLYKAKVANAEQNKHFNNVFFEPFLSFGLHLPYVLVLRRTREEVGHGTALVGPYVSYILNNMSQDNGISMHGMCIGIKWTYVHGFGE